MGASLDRRTLICLGVSAALQSTLPAKLSAQEQAERIRIVKTRLVSAKKAYNYKKIADPTGSAPSERIERFELRGGDCPSAGDCKPRPLNGRMVSRSRTERVLFTDLKAGEKGLFSYYVYFPSAEYNVVTQLGSTFGQLLASLGRSWDSDSMPIFSLDTNEDSKGSLYAQLNEVGTKEGRRENQKRINIGPMRGSSKYFDKWIKVEVRFFLSESNDGYIDFIFGGSKLGRFVGRTILPRGGIELRYGIYQTGTNQFPGGAKELPPQVVYFSKVEYLRLV